MSSNAFAEAARAAVYEVIARRRDVRRFHSDGAVDDATLLRVLAAAHQAPSVGYSQPWDFIVVRDRELRARIRDGFLRCREAEAARYPEPRRARYLAYRLEGILESALNLCVTADLRPADEAVLGTTAQPEALRWSTAGAVQNLWLAARAEGVGVGWVSIVEPALLRAALALPPGIEPVAYLCIGIAAEDYQRPMLEETGWRRARPLAACIHHERYTPSSDVAIEAIHAALQQGDATTQPADVATRQSSVMTDAARPPAATPPQAGAATQPADVATQQTAMPLDVAAQPADVATQQNTMPPVAAMQQNWPNARVAAPAGDLPAVPPFDEAAAAAARAHQDRLCKPPGSLGRLEALGAWYAGARGRFPVAPPARPELYVFAADHGVVAEGVSAYSSAVTAAMVANFVAGGAAVNALAGAADVGLTVVDVGVAGDLGSLAALTPGAHGARFLARKLRAGTGNLRREPAMTRAEAAGALALGARLAVAAAEAGCDLLAAGEMGIGNTTAAAALVCALAGVAPAEAAGRGTGLDDAGVRHKAAVIADALVRHRPDRGDALGVLAALGGLEIAAMAGLMVGGAARRVPTLVDGFISGAAALVAVAVEPATRAYLCLSHRSAERGHAALCAALGLEPLLDLGLRLGEGSGAMTALPLVRAALRVQHEMATFSTAGVPDRR